MITCYFGVPGVGKTTILAKIALKEIRKIEKGKSKYKHVYTNFYLKGAEKITFNAFKDFKMYDSLILIDEITMDADNRHFKSFPNEVRDFFILHRHLGNDIVYATQSYDMVDMKIKNLTADLWYMRKSVAPIFKHFTYARRVWRKVNINEHTSEMTNGYRFCNFVEAIFVSNFRYVFRPKYYKYFDSFEEGVLEPRSVYESSLWGEFSNLTLLKWIQSGSRDGSNFNKEILQKMKSSKGAILDRLTHCGTSQEKE